MTPSPGCLLLLLLILVENSLYSHCLVLHCLSDFHIARDTTHYTPAETFQATVDGKQG